jgi:hypothetical protein
MLLRSTILTTLVGLASAVGFPRDSGPYSTLSQDEMDSTDVYANYAAAVKCGPQNLTNWDCRAFLTCVPFFFRQKERMRCDAR